MKKRTLIVFLILAVITAFCFTACGSKEPMTLEKYVGENPEVQGSIESASAGSNVEVLVKDNEILYNFDLSTTEGYTEEIAKSEELAASLEQALSSAGATFGGISKTLEESSGIKGITTTVNYMWKDEVIYSKSFTSADAAE